MTLCPGHGRAILYYNNIHKTKTAQHDVSAIDSKIEKMSNFAQEHFLIKLSIKKLTKEGTPNSQKTNILN